ncbi:efflux transporter, outer membrane factor (OMF) lipoprotein, NodT family [Sphingopyxis indica]|uniref:Efflux transporter, outer membrane factor (OMF) lipoprotein, NodT family n=2 Tax=Sphingopyxis indica TaxID=436663 RepID=A0A239JXP3_9SPHN|nr:efflux transporter outer membrane subunit [Sphingopyxis indica]SNT10540.1 efflux transporter, outer membrane factor (OMF) lipoprotein, NodT family [Sphingopyxis indica]
MRSRHFAPALLAVLSACTTVGPAYAPPPLPAGMANGETSAFEASASRAISSAPLPDRWWQLYDDARLDALVEDALAANTDLRAAAANLERAQALTREVRAASGVQTSLDGSASVGETSSLGIGNPAGVHDLFSLGGSISYEVDVVGRIRRAIEAATADERSQAAALDIARTTVAAAVVGAYTDACAAGASLSVAERSAALQRQSLTLTEKGVRGGVFAPIDATRSRALLAQLEAALPGYTAARRIALYRLAVLLGRSPQDYPASLIDCASIPSLTRPIPAGDGTALIRRRPDIRQAERRLAAATARIGVETAALYPTIALGASAGTTSRTIEGLTSDSALQFSIGPLISWSFPNRSVARARIDQASASAKVALAEFDGTVLGALQEAESALTQYANDIDENIRLRAARDRNREASDLQTRLARGGAAASLEVLDVERSLANAEAALASSNAKLAADRVRIFLALGGGWN